MLVFSVYGYHHQHFITAIQQPCIWVGCKIKLLLCQVLTRRPIVNIGIHTCSGLINVAPICNGDTYPLCHSDHYSFKERACPCARVGFAPVPVCVRACTHASPFCVCVYLCLFGVITGALLCLYIGIEIDSWLLLQRKQITNGFLVQ